mmetsp:Transcript_74796/g.231156  ORF Transcript_74796/g.231156 Transcript_74796/m.231156 type:complete len:319 (-) Transcript_74796:15-971(-)
MSWEAVRILFGSAPKIADQTQALWWSKSMAVVPDLRSQSRAVLSMEQVRTWLLSAGLNLAWSMASVWPLRVSMRRWFGTSQIFAVLSLDAVTINSSLEDQYADQIALVWAWSSSFLPFAGSCFVGLMVLVSHIATVASCEHVSSSWLAEVLPHWAMATGAEWASWVHKVPRRLPVSASQSRAVWSSEQVTTSCPASPGLLLQHPALRKSECPLGDGRAPPCSSVALLLGLCSAWELPWRVTFSDPSSAFQIFPLVSLEVVRMWWPFGATETEVMPAECPSQDLWSAEPEVRSASSSTSFSSKDQTLAVPSSEPVTTRC